MDVGDGVGGGFVGGVPLGNGDGADAVDGGEAFAGVAAPGAESACEFVVFAEGFPGEDGGGAAGELAGLTLEWSGEVEFEAGGGGPDGASGAGAAAAAGGVVGAEDSAAADTFVGEDHAASSASAFECEGSRGEAAVDLVERGGFDVVGAGGASGAVAFVECVGTGGDGLGLVGGLGPVVVELFLEDACDVGLHGEDADDVEGAGGFAPFSAEEEFAGAGGLVDEDGGASDEGADVEVDARGPAALEPFAVGDFEALGCDFDGEGRGEGDGDAAAGGADLHGGDAGESSGGSAGADADADVGFSGEGG